MFFRKIRFSLLFPAFAPGAVLSAAWAVIFIRNKECFTIGAPEALLVSAAIFMAAASAAALFLLIGAWCRCYRSVLALVFGLTCSMLLQYHCGNELFGEDYLTLCSGIVLLTLLLPHLLMFLLPSVLALRQRRRCCKWRSRITLVLLLTQLVYIGSAWRSVFERSSWYDFKKFSFSEEDKFVFGSKENIIILVVDSMGERIFKEVLKKYPELMAAFRDFTCFDRMVSSLPETMYAVPALLTGVEFPQTEDGKPENDDHGEYLSRACKAKSSLFQLARAGGFRAEGYPFYLQTISYAPEVIDNSIEITEEVKLESVKKIGEVMYRRLIPAFLLPLRTLLISENVLPFVLAGNDEQKNQESFDQIFFRRLQKEFRIGERQKVFKYLHVIGAHEPVNVDENLNSGENIQRYQQLRGSLRIAELLLLKLKEHGIYDSSTIVITGDHSEKYTPEIAALIKRPFDKNERLRFNSVPCSIARIAGSVAAESGLDRSAVSLFALPYVEGSLTSCRSSGARFPEFTPWRRENDLPGAIPTDMLQGRSILYLNRIMIDVPKNHTLRNADEITMTAENVTTRERYVSALIRKDPFDDLLLPVLKVPDGIYLLTLTEKVTKNTREPYCTVNLLSRHIQVKNGVSSFCTSPLETLEKAVDLNRKMIFYPLASYNGVKFSSSSVYDWNGVKMKEKETLMIRLPETEKKCRLKLTLGARLDEERKALIYVNGKVCGTIKGKGAGILMEQFKLTVPPTAERVLRFNFGSADKKAVSPVPFCMKISAIEVSQQE